MAAQPGRDREHGGDDGAALPGRVARAVDPGRLELQRLGERADTAFGETGRPHPARVGGQPVDVVEGEPGVRDRGQAGVDGQPQRVDHQPAPHARLPDPSQHDPFLKLRGRSPGAGGADVTVGRDGEGLVRPLGVGLEQRDVDVAGLLEQHPDGHPDAHVGGRAADDVGSQPDPVVLLERHHRDDVGRREVRQPLLVVDGEPGHHRAAGDGGQRHPVAAAGPAARQRRVGVGAAVGAARDAQHPVAAPGPEPVAAQRGLGQRALDGRLPRPRRLRSAGS